MKTKGMVMLQGTPQNYTFNLTRKSVNGSILESFHWYETFLSRVFHILRQLFRELIRYTCYIDVTMLQSKMATQIVSFLKYKHVKTLFEDLKKWLKCTLEGGICVY